MSAEKLNKNEKRKPWPKDCLWAEPADPNAFGSIWDVEDVEGMELDEDAQELMEIRDYFDELVEEGRLDEEYRLNEEYVDEDQEDEDEPWEPEKGEDFWDGDSGAFDVESWETALLEHVNLLKTEPTGEDPASAVQRLIGYDFVNENLIRQAFTRRAFAIEYGLSGDSEILEFLGDTVLNAVVTREMMDRYTEVNPICTDAPFRVMSRQMKEGDLSAIRTQFVKKEYLASRAAALGLDRYILYGTGESETESAKEDMMEALIGAVAADRGWDWEVLTGVVDRLIRLQLDFPDELLKKSYYERFNAWHQKRFGRMPEYEIHGGRNASGHELPFRCTIRFCVPENERGIPECQRIEAEGFSRSASREMAAEFAWRFAASHGLLISMKDAGIQPEIENSINQLQELWQKKYLDTPPEYTFREGPGEEWCCSCACAGLFGFGTAESKIKAKKKAAFMLLEHLM